MARQTENQIMHKHSAYVLEKDKEYLTTIVSRLKTEKDNLIIASDNCRKYEELREEFDALESSHSSLKQVRIIIFLG